MTARGFNAFVEEERIKSAEEMREYIAQAFDDMGLTEAGQKIRELEIDNVR